MTTLHIRQDAPKDGLYAIRLTLKRPGAPDREAEATIRFALSDQEQEDLRWYLEDYLQRADAAAAVTAGQVEAMMKARGEELYAKVLGDNQNTRALWFSIRDRLADLRVEIAASVAEAASIPWELLRDPQLDSPISLRVESFVRVQSNPNIAFVPVPPAEEGRVRLLYIVCRPKGAGDVPLRAVANRLLQDLGEARDRFDIKALRPPTFEQLQTELANAKAAGRPYHIVHFDGHGIYADLTKTTLASWLTGLSALTLGSEESGKHGYLLFEHSGEDKMRPVDGQTLGQLLHDNGVPLLVLNACQSAMHGATAAPETAGGVHDEIRAIGSLAQAVVDQGIPAVLGMRYSVYVVTAAQYIGQVYAELAKGRNFGQAASEGRKHLRLNPDRWIGLRPHPLQDWFVPVIYEAAPLELLAPERPTALGKQPESDPVQRDRTLLRHVPEQGFIGRDETLLALDRAFDTHPVVLLHAYAGQGKSATAVEFARWYSLTGGLGARPLVFFTSFEGHTDLDDLLNQIAQPFAPLLESNEIHWSALNETAQRCQCVLQVLRSVPVLWIWDNVEPVTGLPEGTESQWTTEEQGELRDFLHQINEDNSSKVKILLTSRRDEQNWLGHVPHRIAMPRMSNSDAARLALRLGEEKHLQPSEIAEWQPLLDYCAGNPLTLRVLIGQAVEAGIRDELQIQEFVEDIRSGETSIEDADVKQGRDKSLGASLDYGFRHAFRDDELPIIALLHLFQGTVHVDILWGMGQVGAHALPELRGRAKEYVLGLLEQAKQVGLLAQTSSRYFTIHPALPWFLGRPFARLYDGQCGRSTPQAALRAWVEAVGALGDFLQGQFGAGNHGIIGALELEEHNLLHARRQARRNQWFGPIISCMQGLCCLYEYQGRWAEWARLVAEITHDYCEPDDEPVSGLEDGYSFVMGYRVRLAQRHERDLAKAAALQGRVTARDRRQAATALALPADASLDDEHRHRLRCLAVSVFALGQIRMEEPSAACLAHYFESLDLCRRIGDKPRQAIVEFNLGHAYKDLPDLRDLDAAEAAYQRSLDLRDPNDRLGRSGCIRQIGSVHHERLREARQRGDPAETLLRHAQAAEKRYLDGLRLCPRDAVGDLVPLHMGLGSLYADTGRTEEARDYYEHSVRYAERAGDHFSAGHARLNMAMVYGQASGRENQPFRRRDLLLRAQAYAEAALRDFQHYQGRAANEEANAGRVLDQINRDLAKLPQ